ncbi:MAG: hypothetical protein NZ611_07400 [Bacteroidia bacterium]|nr:hypothetical protein [Bacteroidia bacterium]
MHVWARPAVGLRYRQTFFHCSPIPPYLSLGASQQIGFFQRKERTDRPIYAAIHFHQRYLATQELRQDKRLVGLLGIRVWLEPYLQRFYFQGGFGLQVQKLSPGRWRILPTAEAHLGGFYRPHTYKPKRFRRKGA